MSIDHMMNELNCERMIWPLTTISIFAKNMPKFDSVAFLCELVGSSYFLRTEEENPFGSFSQNIIKITIHASRGNFSYDKVMYKSALGLNKFHECFSNFIKCK